MIGAACHPSSDRHPAQLVTDFSDIDARLKAPRDGWEPTDVNPAGFGDRQFISETDDDRLRVRYFERVDDGALVGRVWYGPGAEGPPGHAHGGSTAAIIDEIMGTSCWLAGHPVVAGSITVHFRDMVPLNDIVEIVAYIDRIDGRKLHTIGRITAADGSLLAEGEGVFVEIDPSRFQPSDDTP